MVFKTIKSVAHQILRGTLKPKYFTKPWYFSKTLKILYMALMFWSLPPRNKRTWGTHHIIRHYWRRPLCRGLLALPRAISRALDKGVLCRGPAPGALGKARPSAKKPLSRAWKRPSAKWPDGPRQNVRMGHGGHWRHSLPSARRQALGKDFLFFLNILWRGTLARPSTNIFYYFLNILCQGSLARPSAKTPFAEG